MSGKLLQKLQSGKNVYGTCIVSTSPIWSKSVVGAGLDYVFIDTEHIPIDRTEMTFMCQTYNALGIDTILRIPSPDPYLACMARDAGAVGVMAPYIETVSQIQDMIGATKLRPLKGEKLYQALSGEKNLEPELMAYLENYNKGSMCLINIESVAAVRDLDLLLDVSGLDAVIIGPHDLSVNMGLPEQYEHPKFQKTVSEIISKARAKGVSAGIHFPAVPERQIKYMKDGANIIMHSNDMFLFSQKLAEDMEKIKSAAGDLTKETGEIDLVI